MKSPVMFLAAVLFFASPYAVAVSYQKPNANRTDPGGALCH
jgi:hypothetical protein